MGVATGTIDTEAVLADEKVVDMEPKFRLLDPDESQFSTILNKLPSRQATREKVNWLEDQYLPTTITVSGAVTNVATSLTAATGEGVNARDGDLLRNMRTGEMVEVTSVSGDTVNITRGIGDAAA